jgi:hypothetical protein
MLILSVYAEVMKPRWLKDYSAEKRMWNIIGWSVALLSTYYAD